MDDIIEPGAALMVLPVASLPTILAADDKDILSNLLKELEGWEPDVSTERGRKEIASKAQKVRVAKADFGRLADRLKEDAIKTQRAVNAEVKILVERMDALIERVREPLTAFENQEKERVAGHEAALAGILACGDISPDCAADDIEAQLITLSRPNKRDWQEFATRASRAHEETAAKLRAMFDAAVKRENEAAELSRLRAEEAERQRLAELEAQRLREERIAAEAAERAKAEAEARAAREAREAEQKAQAALREQALAAERERAEALRKEREAAEALARAEREKQDAIDRAERDRIAAVEAERARVARAAAIQKAEDDRRAADKAHRGRINREVLADLIGMASMHEAEAKELVILLATGKIRHVGILY